MVSVKVPGIRWVGLAGAVFLALACNVDRFPNGEREPDSGSATGEYAGRYVADVLIERTYTTPRPTEHEMRGGVSMWTGAVELVDGESGEFFIVGPESLPRCAVHATLVAGHPLALPAQHCEYTPSQNVQHTYVLQEGVVLPTDSGGLGSSVSYYATWRFSGTENGVVVAGWMSEQVIATR